MAGPPKNDGLGKAAEAYRRAAPYLSLGWTFVAAVGIGCLAGWFLDKKLGTEPWLLVTGAMLGMAAGFVGLLRTVSALGKRER